MDRDEKVEARARVAKAWGKIWTELHDLLVDWERNDWPADLVAEEEWPFCASLEDLEAEVSEAQERIEKVNDLMMLEPVKITVPREEFERLLAELEEPPKVLPKLKALLEDNRPLDGNGLA